MSIDGVVRSKTDLVNDVLLLVLYYAVLYCIKVYIGQRFMLYKGRSKCPVRYAVTVLLCMNRA